ncbi:accessory gene regulator B family protein [Tepidibacillus marianensis]|uniref:accessory gene regulator ArgB-like protein n=1 Tax=Tepidibacillus marianensis TaxID=3131995 RepID=UPI0030D1C3F9
MIRNLAHYLAKKIATGADRWEDVDYIRYGLEVTIGGFLKFLIVIIISLLFGVLKEMMTITISFALFRILTGGIHMSTYFKCLTTSTILFFIPAYVFKDIAVSNVPLLLLIFTSLFTLFVIFRYVPVESPNRPLSKKKQFRLKWTSSFFIFSWFIFAFIISLNSHSFQYLAFFTSVGLLLQAFTLTPIGIHFFLSIDQGLQRKKGLEV